MTIVKETGRPKSGYRNAAGKRVVGTTTAAKDSVTGLLIWSNELGLEGVSYREHMDGILAQANAIHDAVEAIIKGGDPDACLATLSPEERKGAERGIVAFRRWLAVTDVKILHTEFPLVSEKYQYGGTPDGYGIVAGVPSLLDWKSGALRSDHIVQMGAYRQLIQENHIGKVEEAHVCRFNRDTGTFVPMQLDKTALDLGWDAFQKRLELYHLGKELRKYAA